MTSVGLCSTSDVIAFDQDWHHLYSSSAGGKDLSNDTQIRVIGSIEHEMCTKILRNLSEKLGGKSASTTLGYSVVRISRLDDAFSGILEQEASPVEKIGKGEKGKVKKKTKSVKT